MRVFFQAAGKDRPPSDSRREKRYSYRGKRCGGGTGGRPGREGLLLLEGLEGPGRETLLGREGWLRREGRDGLLGGEGGRLLDGLLSREGRLAAQASLIVKSTGAVYTTPVMASPARTRLRCCLNVSCCCFCMCVPS